MPHLPLLQHRLSILHAAEPVLEVFRKGLSNLRQCLCRWLGQLGQQLCSRIGQMKGKCHLYQLLKNIWRYAAAVYIKRRGSWLLTRLQHNCAGNKKHPKIITTSGCFVTRLQGPPVWQVTDIVCCYYSVVAEK